MKSVSFRIDDAPARFSSKIAVLENRWGVPVTVLLWSIWWLVGSREADAVEAWIDRRLEQPRRYLDRYHRTGRHRPIPEVAAS